MATLSRCLQRAVLHYRNLPKFDSIFRAAATSAAAVSTQPAPVINKLLPSLQPQSVQATFTATLTDIVRNVDNGRLEASEVPQNELDELRIACEKSINTHHFDSREPADWHAILRVYAGLRLPVSATLRDRARRWLCYQCRQLDTDNLFSLFGQLSSFPFFDSLCLAAQMPESELQLCPTSESEFAQQPQPQPHFNEASVAHVMRFLARFDRMGINPKRFNPNIVNDLIAKFTALCNQLTVEEGVELVQVLGSRNWTLGDQFWLAFCKRFTSVEPTEASRLARTLGQLLNDHGFITRQSSATVLLLRKTEVIWRSGIHVPSWHTQTTSCSIEATFQDLSALAGMDTQTEFTVPTVEWWAAFRHRLTIGSFCINEANWLAVAKTVGQLSNIQHSHRSKHHDCPKNDRLLLPPDWYSKMLQLCDSQTAKRPASGPTYYLLRLLSAQHIQLDDDLKTLSAGLCERHCMQKGNFGSLLIKAMMLQLPVSEAQWQRVLELLPQFEKVPAISKRLLLWASCYWALRLPGAPSPTVLHHLVLANLYKKHNINWHKLSVLLNDEFMPQKWLQQRPDYDKSPDLVVVGGNVVEVDSELGLRLKRQYGAILIQTGVRLAKMGGEKVDYLLTKADGSQMVLQRDAVDMHYWRMPADVQGGPTIRSRVLAYTSKKAGYGFALLEN